MAIRNYRDRRTATFVSGERVPAFQSFERQAIKAIAILQTATRLIELRRRPANHFEALRGDRVGEYSIKINDRWRVCFRWEFTEAPAAGADPLMVRGEPFDVEISDHYK